MSTPGTAPSDKEAPEASTWKFARGARVQVFALLASFYLLAGSRWLLDSAVPSAGSTFESAGLGCGLAAIGLAGSDAYSGRRSTNRTGSAGPGQEWYKVFAGGSALLGPALGSWLSGRHISGNTGTLAMALTPVVVAVGKSAMESHGDIAGQLWPGLAGLAGLLLLLPEPDLSHWRPDAALLAMPLLAGVGAVLAVDWRPGAAESVIQAGPRPFSDSWMAKSLALSGGTFLLLHLANGGSLISPPSLLASCADGLISLLSLVVLARLFPLRWSAQYLLIPFVTITEGVLLLRPALTGRAWLGLGCLLGGGLYLLFERAPE